MKAITCSDGRRRRRSATAMPPSAPPANISRTRSRLATSPRGEQPRGDQPEQPRSHAPSVPPIGSLVAVVTRPRPARDRRAGDRAAAVVASAAVHDFPAGRFAVWATAWLSGRTSYDDALDALHGDTAHRVTGLPGTDAAVPLGWALTALRGLGERRFRLVLPVPGDVRGLPRGRRPAPRSRWSRVRPPSATGWRWCPRRSGPEAIGWTAFAARPAPPPAPPPVEGTLRAAVGRARPGRRRRRPHAGRRSTWPAGTRRCPALLAGLARPTPAPGLPGRPRPAGALGAGPGRSGWPRCSTWRWPTRRAPRSPARRPPARDDALRPLADAVREAVVAAFNDVPR